MHTHMQTSLHKFLLLSKKSRLPKFWEGCRVWILIKDTIAVVLLQADN